MRVPRVKSRSHLAGMVACLALAFICCAHLLTVKDLGIFGTSRKRSVLGQDGCTPIPIGNAMMWTFGDTILGTWKGELSSSATFEDSAVMKGMISNSLAFTRIPDDETIADLDFLFYKEEGTVAPFIKHNPGEDPSTWRFWAIDGILIGETVCVYYIIVKIDKSITVSESNPMPIRIEGVGLAEWRKPADWIPGDPVSFRRTVKLFSANEPVFGDSVIRHGDFLYLIGHGPAAGKRVPAYAARVPATSIRNRAAYKFLDDNGRWVAGIKNARPLFQDVMGELSLSYNERLGRYIIIYCSLDGMIKLAAFKDFPLVKSRETFIIYVPPTLPVIPSRPNLFYYSGKEILHTGRAIYAIYINPALYQPMLLKIPYPAIPLK
ncbi:MAG: DUF4185 domain-containing protein [Spirochaetes bacterium]|nr:DUF4185 domain-containing protein [Spirochaetota bacterium]